jgi:hypothetical protein
VIFKRLRNSNNIVKGSVVEEALVEAVAGQAGGVAPGSVAFLAHALCAVRSH